MEALTFALLGIGVGAIYGMIAQGLVLVYRGSGILNFAQGAFLMVGGFIFYELHVLDRWSYFPALIVAMLACGAIGTAVHLFILRPMRHASALARIVATLGVMGLLSAIAQIIYQGNTEAVPASLPTTSITVLPGIHMGADIVIIFAIGLGLTIALWAAYRFTSFGRVTSAVAENQLAASATGHSPDLIAAINWGLGGALAALAGVLIAPMTYLQSDTLVLMIIPAIGAGLLGAYSSFPLAFVGGLILGMTQSLISLYVTSPGWSLSIPYLLIIIYLFARGRAIPLRTFVIDRLPKVGTGKIRPIPILVLSVIIGIVLFNVPGQWSAALAVTLSFAVITLSVVVVTGYAGQLSLAQYVMAGVGALTAGRLSADWHFPFLLAVLGALVLCGCVGAVIAIPSFRARGISLAVATLAVGMVLFDLVLNNYTLSGGQNGVAERTPTFFGWNVNPATYPARYGLVVLILLLILFIAVANIRRSIPGRRMLAVRSNERAAAALGVNIYATKVYAFVVSSAIAGVGGVLLAFASPVVTSGNFDLVTSINFVTSTVVGGVGSLGGALIGALLIPGGFVAQIFFGIQQINAWIPLAGSVGLLLVLRRHSSGLFELNRELLFKFIAMVRRAKIASFSAAPIEPGAKIATLTRSATQRGGQVSPVSAKTLRVEHLHVQFGGVVAVEDVSIEASPGEVHGLIGPNGAGKTTLIDAVTGFAPAASGAVTLDDVDVSSWSARKRSRAGLARSFQSLELFGDLTVLENLAVGCDDGKPLHFASSVFWPGKIQLSELALDGLERCGLSSMLDVTPDSLSFGKRRLIAIVRALASRPSVLLLDEPAAGLDDAEAEEVGELLRWLADDQGIAVLLIEHNLEMVTSVSDRLTVLASGRVLATGIPREVMQHAAVLDAYVGEAFEDIPA